MDGLDAVFYVLVVLFILTVAYLQVSTLLQKNTEGFDTVASTSLSVPSTSLSPAPSTIEVQIRKALDPYLNADLCNVYKEIRSVIAQNIQGDTLTPTADTEKKVEAYLTTEITLPPLPCPVFTYPTGKAELEWVNFLNALPTDIGARFVLMAIYAQREMKFRANNVKTALSRGTPVPESEKNSAENMRKALKIVLSSLVNF